MLYMLAGRAMEMEFYYQVASIVYRHICAEYDLEVPKAKQEKPPRVVENERANILWPDTNRPTGVG